MPAELSDISCSSLSELVAEYLGLHFPKERWADLERGVCASAREYGDGDMDEYLRRLLSSTPSSREVEILASHLTIGETYFFREKQSFDILEEKILPQLIHARRATAQQQLRVWSAGCATGEEPYSIAILLSRMIPDLKDWNILILATDLNVRSLEKAERGVYGDWSFRNAPPWVRSRYFTATSDDRWAVVPTIRKMVKFASLNLVKDAYPSLLNATTAIDIILCRNVLMYLTPGAAKEAVDGLYRSLASNGWLMVAPAEASNSLFSQFASVSFAHGTLYRKATKQPEMVLSLAPGGPDQPIELVHLPESFVEHERFAAALQKAACSPVQPDRTESGKILLTQAVDLYSQGHYKLAEAKINVALSGNDRDGQATLFLARLFANQGLLAEALQWCERALRSNKMDASAHYLRALILLEQGLLQEAALSLRRAIYVSPGLVLAHFALGNLAMRQRKLKESQRCFHYARMLLANYREGDVLLESDGLTAGRLRDWVRLHLDQLKAMKDGAAEKPHCTKVLAI